jgi:4-hydroxy-3-methylbut-2-enyl diphosphate reductase
MDIVIGKNSGFCQGVSYTVTKAYEAINNPNKAVYCLGEIVHNERVVNELKEKGMHFVESLEEIPANSLVIVRAHGATKEVYDEIHQKGFELLDLTCGKIRVIRNNILKENENSFIVMIGKKNHPETLGTISFCDNGMILESEDDFEELKSLLKVSNKKRIYILSQTTFGEERFIELSSKIRVVFYDYDVEVNNTICSSTHDRQEETKAMAITSDSMIIVGGKNSSNTKELYNVAKESCLNSFLIQDVNGLDDSITGIINQKKDVSIGIMAGASTTKEAVNEIVDKLKSFVIE